MNFSRGKKLKLLLPLLILASCAKDPVSTSTTNNSNIPVSTLFEHEGCKVYRFQDEGRYRYFTNCTEAFGDNSESCGKIQCPKNESIRTSHKGK